MADGRIVSDPAFSESLLEMILQVSDRGPAQTYPVDPDALNFNRIPSEVTNPINRQSLIEQLAVLLLLLWLAERLFSAVTLWRRSPS